MAVPEMIKVHSLLKVVTGKVCPGTLIDFYPLLMNHSKFPTPMASTSVDWICLLASANQIPS